MKQLAVLFVSVVALSCPRSLVSAELRVWTDKSGRFTIKAELESASSEIAILRSADGSKNYRIRIEELSDADRQFLLKQTPQQQSANDAEQLLFDGRTLDGWQSENGKAVQGWTLVNGCLVSASRNAKSDLFSVAKLDDFELECEFWLEPRANSGIYLGGPYEVQLIDNPAFPEVKPNQLCGAIWRQVTPTVNAYKGARQWNSLKVTRQDNVFTVVMNDILVIDHKRLGVDSSLTVNHSGPGPLIFQHSVPTVKYRGVRARKLRSDTATPATAPATDDRIIGTYQIAWTEKTASGTTRYRFTTDGYAYKDDRKVGRWLPQGTGFVLQYTDKSRGSVAIRRTNPNSIEGIHTWADGKVSQWVGVRTKD